VQRVTDWDDAGTPGAKFLQGFRLRANTYGQPASLYLEYFDETLTLQYLQISINHPDETIVPYSLSTPFVAHLMRFLPSTAGNPIQLFGVEWVFEPMPELATNWITQPTTHDLEGFQHLRDGYLPLMAPAAVTLNILDDTGNPLGGGIAIPATGGTLSYLKAYWVPVANKSRAYTYSATSEQGFRVFIRDLEVRTKAWGDPGPYHVVRPFGDVHREAGARI